MIDWHIEKRKVKDLKDNPKNPRQISKHEEKQLVQSIERFGLIDKPCVNTDNILIGGHQRTRILKKLGYKEIDVYVPHRTLTQDEVDELCLRLNKNSGTFDYELLANEWDTDLLIDVGFSAFDFLEEDDKPQPKKKTKKCPHCGEEL